VNKEDKSANSQKMEETKESKALPNAIVTEEDDKKNFSGFRQFGFTLRCLIGDYRYATRRVYKEFRAMFHLIDLIFVALGFIVVAGILLLGVDIVIPEFIRMIFDPATATNINEGLAQSSTIRLIAGLFGAGGVVIRLIMKPPVIKFIRKSKINEDITYVFGSTPYAERLLKEMVKEYAYEDKVALISDKDLLWVRSVSPWIDTIWVNPNSGISSIEEFGKEWFYDRVGFENAKQIFILTDSVELNQNILTNIRRLRPNVDMYILANYAPAFLRSDKQIDPHVHLIDDIEAITKALVLSLSLDIKWPKTAEIDVPVTYYKSPATAITAEIPAMEVLAVKRDGKLLPPSTVLDRYDRLLLWYDRAFDMKRTNRVVQEFLIQPWPPRNEKHKEKLLEQIEHDDRVDESVKEEIGELRDETEKVIDEATEEVEETLADQETEQAGDL